MTATLEQQQSTKYTPVIDAIFLNELIWHDALSWQLSSLFIMDIVAFYNNVVFFLSFIETTFFVHFRNFSSWRGFIFALIEAVLGWFPLSAS